MKKLLVTFAFFPLFLPAFSFSSIKNVVESGGDVTVINSTETKAEGSNARTESGISTTVNGENVTVKTNQPGLVEVKNINGKIEIKTSKGVTPTIIVTGTPSQPIAVEEKKFVKINFLKNFWKRFLNFFNKT